MTEMFKHNNEYVPDKASQTRLADRIHIVLHVDHYISNRRVWGKSNI
jgi:hypothetical protein